MGLFTKTPEEIKAEEDRQKLSNMIYEINNSNNIDSSSKSFLTDYINKIRGGYPNTFNDLDTLYLVLSQLLSTNYIDHEDFIFHFNEVSRLFKIIVDKSSQSNFEKSRDRFINSFIGTKGIIYNKLFDDSFYSIFANKEDFFDIMDILNSNDIYLENFKTIKNYIQDVSKFCLNQDVLKRDIISYLTGFSNVVDNNYEGYSHEELVKAKKRIGIYDITPRELAEVDTKLTRAKDILEELDLSLDKVNSKQVEIANSIEEGKRQLKSSTNSSIRDIHQEIHNEELSLIKKLDEHLVDLERLMTERSDETFKQILENYKNQITDLKQLLTTYSSEANKELIKIQKTTEESLQSLKDYIKNEPKISELIRRAQEENASREEIVELAKKELEQERAEKNNNKDQIVLPGYDRVMVPYRHMTLPETISTASIPSLDENISFSKRKEDLLKRKEQKEKAGEIYHKKIVDIAVDIMEGDWPYLWGPSGTGKSYMIKQVADLLGMKQIKAGKITEPYSILGYNDPQGRYMISPTFVAALYGHLLTLDEFDNGNPDTQVVLNDIYSELLNKLDNPNEPCEVLFGGDIPVDININFRMAGIGNTNGEGENEMFSSRGKIDESIHERWTPIYIDYDPRVEQLILNDYPEWFDFFIKFREACNSYAQANGLSEAIGSTSTRDANALRKYISHNSKSVDQIIFEMFIQTKEDEYCKNLARKLADMYNIDYETCPNPNFNQALKKASSKVLAKKFINFSKNGAR